MSVEFTHNGHTYRAGRLNAKQQLHVLRRLAPLFSGLMESGALARAKGVKKPEDIMAGLTGDDVSGIFKALGDAVATLPDADVDYVLDTCLAGVERQQAGGGWAKVMSAGQLMFQDLDMAGMLQITWQVIQHNLTGFFGMLPQGSPGVNRT